MAKDLSSSQTPYLVIVVVVAVVAVVTLLMNRNDNSLQGAPVSDFVDGCYASDPDYRFDKKGFVQVGSNKKWDYCIPGTNVLHQYSCDHKVARPLRPIKCPFGCENGVCLSNSKIKVD